MVSNHQDRHIARSSQPVSEAWGDVHVFEPMVQLEQRLLLTTINVDAALLYTSDGSTPLPQNSLIYLVTDGGDGFNGDLSDPLGLGLDSNDSILFKEATNNQAGGGFPGTHQSGATFNLGGNIAEGHALRLVWANTPFTDQDILGGEIEFNFWDFTETVPAQTGNVSYTFFTPNTGAGTPGATELSGATTQITNVIPEPATAVLAMAGLGLMFGRRARRA